jgi:hypothetical protein
MINNDVFYLINYIPFYSVENEQHKQKEKR